MKLTKPLCLLALATAAAALVAPTFAGSTLGNKGVAVLMGTPMKFNYQPPESSTTVSNGSKSWTLSRNVIHQTATSAGTAAPNIKGTFAYPVDIPNSDGWHNLYFRWADTTRADAITMVPAAGADGIPAYRMELGPVDGGLPGTLNNAPRAELVSVDPREDLRQKDAPRNNVVKNGDEYWVTYAMFLDANFPLNHKWADLFQRKFDKVFEPSAKKTWFEIAVHGDSLSYCMPGGIRNQCDYKTIMPVREARGRWVQFTFHEVASTDPAKGLFEVYVDNNFVGRYNGATLESAAANYSFHYGYERSNAARNGDTAPGVGVAYFTPLMFRRGDARDNPLVPRISGGAPGTTPPTIPPTIPPTTPPGGTDVFGVTMLNPSKPGGESWALAADATHDSRFDPQNTITRNADGSWKIKSNQVRMSVFTSTGYNAGRIATYDRDDLARQGYMQAANDWKNIEMTGYVKLNAASDMSDNFDWYARGGKHNDNLSGCEGSSYKGALHYDGRTRWQKETWHVSYEQAPYKNATTSLKGRWVGFKAVMRNTPVNGKTAVRLELFLNDNADKVSWRKIYDFVDAGDWGGDASHCGGSVNAAPITWGGPISVFRWDNANDVDFKWLSVREIAP
ncbi:polysaccharide lyase [Massilia sp. CF038]|uniref:polysaccharide lyase n=1 Tax=Massilia sp. CF038 TaxID=1881045 RepID=UPI00091EACD7|nr:polysaccharide lyase [Massilia sp. CF038]SHH40562.1 hypothetical protein SAMN05428948_3862 [Massilia sp. CF038]